MTTRSDKKLGLIILTLLLTMILSVPYASAVYGAENAVTLSITTHQDKGEQGKPVSKTADSKDSPVPETGDEGLNPLWLILLAISAAAIVVIVIRTKKH